MGACRGIRINSDDNRAREAARLPVQSGELRYLSE